MHRVSDQTILVECQWIETCVVFVVKEMVESPFETQSDSFYFVNGRLIMHNKAYFAYNT